MDLMEEKGKAAPGVGFVECEVCGGRERRLLSFSSVHLLTKKD